MSFAQALRGKAKEDAIRRGAVSDPHSYRKFRVLGPLPNIDAWYEAFDVKPGDKLYRSRAIALESGRSQVGCRLLNLRDVFRMAHPLSAPVYKGWWRCNSQELHTNHAAILSTDIRDAVAQDRPLLDLEPIRYRVCNARSATSIDAGGSGIPGPKLICGRPWL